MKLIVLISILISTTTLANSEVDCDGLCGQKIATEFDNSLIQALSNITRFSTPKGYPDTLANDPRKVRSASSPSWLAAVGRSVSNTSSTTKEQCTLSIVTDSPEKDGIIAVTAGHCVDHWSTGGGKFEVGSNESTFTTNSGKTIKRSITQVLKAEMNPGDYAIVKLNAPISRKEIKPLLNAPYAYQDLLDEEMFGEKFKPFATMAGHSADKGLGKKGKVLTYDEKCRLNGGASGMKKGYCHSYEGASGGPVVVTVALGDMADEDYQIGTQHYFVGSIVGGRSADDYSKTMFTETTHYTSVLDKILASH